METPPPAQNRRHMVSPRLSSTQHNSSHAVFQRSQPTSIPTNWRNRPDLKLKLERLPSGVSTLQIYNNFEQYGTVVYIKIFETRSGGRSSDAEILFEPVPERRFWGRGLEFRTESGQLHFIRAYIRDNVPRRLATALPTLTSEVLPPEKIELLGDALDFGFLTTQASMTVATTCSPTSIHLNTERKEFAVHFTFTQHSKTSKARQFRFLVALDDDFKLWRHGDYFVLHLTKPPLYSKMLSENISSSHVKDARTWSINDAWARQSDLCAAITTYRQLERLPVGLPKTYNTINIARWTTFRFHVQQSAQNLTILGTFLAEMEKANARIANGGNFSFQDASKTVEQETWCKIDGFYEDSVIPPSLADESPRIHLPFEVRYQLEVCLSNGRISEYSITPQFLHRLVQLGNDKAKQVLVYVATNNQRVFDPMAIFDDLRYCKPLRPKSIPDNCIEIRSATVTATSVLFHTPSIELANRILRKHRHRAHRFLRVRFADDDYRGQSKLWPSLNARMVQIFKRVHRALAHGIDLGDVHYDFLAWGSSQLRQHGAYFVAPIDGMTAESIRKEMGTFKETIVAKKAARMGQCFSTTKAVSLKLSPIKKKDLIPDIIRDGYNFTDGVGKISSMAAKMIQLQLGIKGETPPSVFQFRRGGCKGVLAVSDELKGISVEMRQSQLKFESVSEDLEIIRCSEFWHPCLNRQLILCLSHLGVPTKVFLDMEKDMMDGLNKSLLNDGAATTMLRNNIDANMMTLSICDLVEAGFRRSRELFTTALLGLWRTWSLKSLKQKGRIPVESGAFVLGCVDETATLKGHTSACPSGERHKIEQDPDYLEKLPEIFLQVTDVTTKKKTVIEKICIVARNPSLHPGDIRVVRAVDVPALHDKVDTVVMPQLGDRDISSMCSGGDLDGDDYVVIWDPKLIPRIWNVEPFHYEPPAPREAEGEITTAQLIEFFCNYMRFDHLGKIGHAHLGAADFLDESIASDVCLELVELHSQAVDYPKTGVPAIMPRRLQRDRWPHFMEKRGAFYKSRKVLGLLYDEVEPQGFEPDYTLPFDDRILNAYSPSKELYESIQNLKQDYDSSVRRILTQHSIKTEFELWSTFVLDHSKASNEYKFHEEIGELSRTLKAQYLEALCDLAGGKDHDHLVPVTVAAYRVTHDQLRLSQAKVDAAADKPPGQETLKPLISFPWLLQETMIKIAARAGEPETRSDVAVIEAGQLGKGTADAVVDDEGNRLTAPSDTKRLKVSTYQLSQYLDDPAELDPNTFDEVELLDEDGTTGPDSDGQAIDTPITETFTTANILGDENIVEAISEGVEPDTGEMPPPARAERKQPLIPEAHFLVASDDLRTQHETSNSNSNATKTDFRTPTAKAATCFYWKTQGHCKFSDSECKFAHFHTGCVAPPPQSPIRGLRRNPSSKRQKAPGSRTRTAIDDSESDSDSRTGLRWPKYPSKGFSKIDLYDTDDDEEEEEEEEEEDMISNQPHYPPYSPASKKPSSIPTPAVLPTRSRTLSPEAPPFTPRSAAHPSIPTELASPSKTPTAVPTKEKIAQPAPKAPITDATKDNSSTLSEQRVPEPSNQKKDMIGSDPADLSDDDLGFEELSD